MLGSGFQVSEMTTAAESLDRRAEMRSPGERAVRQLR